MECTPNNSIFAKEKHRAEGCDIGTLGWGWGWARGVHENCSYADSFRQIHIVIDFIDIFQAFEPFDEGEVIFDGFRIAIHHDFRNHL